jgi:HEAT repeat protein
MRVPVASRSVCVALSIAAVFFAPAARPSAQVAGDNVTAEQLRTAIDTLGSLDFPVRTAAARTVRRAPAATAVPALIQAVSSHKDEYVRFRALVVLSGFNDPRTRDVVLKSIADRNDRLRAVAYAWLEHHPDPSMVPRLLQALSREESEFVRPALTRALAVYTADLKAREVMSGLVMKGQDIFRAAVIEALGDYKCAYALKPIADVATLDGPLQDDAVLAIGKLGDKQGIATLAALQRTAPRTLQPSIAAAICLLGSNCSSHQNYIAETLRFATSTAGFQPLLRSAAGGLAALAVAGDKNSAQLLIERGVPARDPERAAIALALGMVALRNTPLMMAVLEAQANPDGAVELLWEAFDMLEEDYEEERFFALVRRTYWQAGKDSPTRRVAESLIRRLEF